MFSPQTNEIKRNAMKELLQKESIKKILVVDDEEIISNLFKVGLEMFGYEVVVASNANEGLKCFKENPADLIITDMFMPKKNGHTFILEILDEFPETKFFVISGDVLFAPEMKLNIEKNLGSIKVFTKPIKIGELIPAIKELSA